MTQMGQAGVKTWLNPSVTQGRGLHMTNMVETQLLERVERIERWQRKGARRMAGVILVSLGVLAAMAPAPKALQATRFVLVDSEGKPRGALQMSKEGLPELVLMEPDGSVCAGLVVVRDGAMVTVANRQGKRQIALISRHDLSAISLGDERNATRAQLVVDTYVPADEERVRLLFTDRQGRTRMHLGHSESGAESLDFWPGDGKEGVELALSKGVGPLLWLKDASGLPGVELTAGKGHPDVTLVDSNVHEIHSLWDIAREVRAQPSSPQSGVSAGGRRGIRGGYAGVGGGHWVKEVADSGALVILEDGSMWDVSPLDRIYTTLWLATEDIIVLESDDPLYPYKLVNTDDKETVEVKYLGVK